MGKCRRPFFKIKIYERDEKDMKPNPKHKPEPTPKKTKTLVGAYKGIEFIANQSRLLIGNVDYLYQVFQILGILIAEEIIDEHGNKAFNYRVNLIKSAKLKELLEDE